MLENNEKWATFMTSIQNAVAQSPSLQTELNLHGSNLSGNSYPFLTSNSKVAAQAFVVTCLSFIC
jgi:hypothetical protein